MCIPLKQKLAKTKVAKTPDNLSGVGAEGSFVAPDNLSGTGLKVLKFVL